MKKNITIIAAVALFAAVSCQTQKNVIDTDTDLIGEITEDKVLGEGGIYYLTGGLHVKEGATLTIEPGVTVIAKEDDIVDYILIEQGARINAQGTPEKPIVLTSERKEAGSWGGLHICGKAPINIPGIDAKSEIGDASYGGNNPEDNSGIIRYVRVEYGGYAFSEEKEANGFTFYGVGNGTTAEYLQAYEGSDDGFEWFGGTVNVKYLVSTNNTDDSFDWTEGWCGNAQFLVAIQNSAECDCLIEADNNSNDEDADPVSHPTLSNVTLVGNNSADAKRGIRLRAGTNANLYNVIVTGKSNPLTTETSGTETSLKNGDSKLSYVYLSGEIKCSEGIYDKEQFLSDGTNMENQQFDLNGYVGSIKGGIDPTSLNSFFSAGTFIGGISSSDNWTSGWTR